MFRQFVLKVMGSYEGQRLVERAVRTVLEDEGSSTRKGMMRIIRGVARDSVQDARERERELVELDAGYQEWTQQRRQAILEQQNAERSALVDFVRTGVEPAPVDLLAAFEVDAIVRVTDDALFAGRIGRVVDTSTEHGYPEVRVELEGHTLWMAFTPGALELATEQAPEDAPADARSVMAAYNDKAFPRFNEARIAELRAAGLSEESAVAMDAEEQQAEAPTEMLPAVEQ